MGFSKLQMDARFRQAFAGDCVEDRKRQKDEQGQF
jgi:hypothetical protein